MSGLSAAVGIIIAALGILVGIILLKKSGMVVNLSVLITAGVSGGTIKAGTEAATAVATLIETSSSLTGCILVTE